MKRGVLCLIILIICAVSVNAQTEDVKTLLTSLSQFKSDYNENIDKVPTWAKNVLGSEKINATLILKDNTAINIGIIFRDGQMVEMRQGRLKKPTINLIVSEQNILDLLAIPGYQKRLENLKEAYDAELINYEYLTFKTKVKFTTVGMAYGLFSSIRN
tara:strand:+ start:4716 stop:5189 length:474 start_codon:yes stop_codon:yes gene_type:complete